MTTKPTLQEELDDLIWPILFKHFRQCRPDYKTILTDNNGVMDFARDVVHAALTPISNEAVAKDSWVDLHAAWVNSYVDVNDDGICTAGINTPYHGDIIECHGMSEAEAIKLRDTVFEALSHEPVTQQAGSPANLSEGMAALRSELKMEQPSTKDKNTWEKPPSKQTDSQAIALKLEEIAKTWSLCSDARGLAATKLYDEAAKLRAEGN